MKPNTLLAAALPDRWNEAQRWSLRVFLVLLGTLAIWASAKIQVPFYPVPMTLQTLAIVLIGCTYGAPLGLATVATYLVAGAFGVPVFAGTPEKGIGLAYMVGPTGGYLLGFIIGVWLAGTMAARGWDRSLWRACIMTVAATFIIFVPGVAYLAVLFGGLEKAFTLGAAPFLLGGMTKALIVACLLRAGWKILERLRRDSGA